MHISMTLQKAMPLDNLPPVARKRLLAERIRILCGSYGPKMKEILVLKYAYGFPNEDVMAIMGCTESALKQAEKRGMDCIERNWGVKHCREILETGVIAEYTANPSVEGRREAP